MRDSRRSILTVLQAGASALCLALGLAGPDSAAAETAAAYPGSKPITIVVPFAAGGGTDLLARFWGAELQKKLGQTVIVEVRAGAGGLIGTRYVAAAPPDGYTLLIATPAFGFNPFLMKDAGYDPLRDFEAVSIVGTSPIAIVVPLASPINSVKDLLEKARSAPGALNVGNAGFGSVGQMAAAAFQAHTQVRFTEIPYKGAAPALIDLIGGRTQAQFEAFPSVLSQIKTKAVKVIGVTTGKRSSLLPDTPTAGESGAPGYAASSWTAFMAPAKTPPAIIEKLNAAFREALADPAVIAGIADQFGSDPGSGNPTEAAAFVAARIKENRALTQAMNVVPQ